MTHALFTKTSVLLKNMREIKPYDKLLKGYLPSIKQSIMLLEALAKHSQSSD
jgi:pyridoxal/pyridoxine/pyridoxamine kinase